MSIAEKYSDFMVYVDESGDHSLQSVDKNYPMFVLAFTKSITLNVLHERFSN